MKNTLKIFGIFFMSLVLVTSCEKDDEPTKDGYRIKEVLTQRLDDSDHFYKKTFIYKGDRLVTRKIEDHAYGKTWKEKTTFAYLENKISAVTNFTERGSDEWKLHDKKEYILENGLVKSKIQEYFNGNKNTTKYEYNGKNLTKIIYNDGRYDASIYDNNRIVEYKIFKSDGSLYGKNIFEYTEGKLMRITSSYGNYLSNKSEYKYSGNKISEETVYNFNNNEWKLEKSTSYKYNNKGLLIEEVSNNIKVTYKYERGKGNARLFQNPYDVLLQKEPIFQ